MAASLFFAFLFLSSLSSIVSGKNAHHAHRPQQPPPPLPNLSLDYYAKTCPRFNDIVQNIIVSKQIAQPTTAAATLRLFFHDCMVSGCDASVLVASNTYNKAERDSDLNESLAGDGFDVVLRIKTALELECPGIVSCADILAVATRNLISMVGGPTYELKFGRKDSLVSKVTDVEGHLARANSTTNSIIKSFKQHGFTLREMVVLMGGGHTIGFAHCKEFETRMFGSKADPAVHPKLAERLKVMCANSSNDPTIAAFLDPISPGVFDNTIFQNLMRGLGVLGTDQAMASDRRTRPLVEEYALNSQKFFTDFARAMEKLSLYNVKTGNQGEVRRRCDAFNTHAAFNSQQPGVKF